ncbi:probable inactive DNA (cytosine-5)-methyltransferase DRM3 isoform X1, partial [Tanacetum coccineum]
MLWKKKQEKVGDDVNVEPSHEGKNQDIEAHGMEDDQLAPLGTHKAVKEYVNVQPELELSHKGKNPIVEAHGIKKIDTHLINSELENTSLPSLKKKKKKQKGKKPSSKGKNIESSFSRCTQVGGGDFLQVVESLALSRPFSDKRLKEHNTSKPNMRVEIVDNGTWFFVLASDGYEESKGCIFLFESIILYEQQNDILANVGHSLERILVYPLYHTQTYGLSLGERLHSLKHFFHTHASYLSVLNDLLPDGITLLSIHIRVGGAEITLIRLGIQLKASFF